MSFTQKGWAADTNCQNHVPSVPVNTTYNVYQIKPSSASEITHFSVSTRRR